MALQNMFGDIALDATLTDGTQKSQIVNSAGTPADVTAGNALKVDGSDVTQPVSDGGGSLTIDDGGSSITVDGSVVLNAGTSTIGKVKITDGSHDANVRDVTGTKSLDVSIVDASGNQITTFGSSVTQYTEGDVDATVTGTAVMWEDSGHTLRSVSASKPLPVGDGGGSLTVDGTVTANAGTGTFAISAASLPLPSGAATAAKQPALGTAGTASADVITVQGIASMTALKVDGSAVTQPVSGTVSIGSGVNYVGKVRLTDGTHDAFVRDVTGSKSLDVSIVDGSGNQITTFVPTQYTQGDVDATITGTAVMWEDASNTLRSVSAASPLPIGDGGGSLTVDGTVTANAGTGTFAISAASLPLPSGAATAAKQPALGTAGTASADVITVQGIASMTALTVDGSAVTQPVSDGGGSLTVDNNGTFAVQAAGTVAHDGADSGNPLKVGAKATTGLHSITAVANADRTDLYAGIDGVLVTREHSNLESMASGTMSNTDGASTAMTNFAAAGAGVKWYITDVIMSNSSGTNVTVDLRDGTAGSVKATFPVPANGGVVHRFAVPVAFTANTAVAIDASAAITTLNVTLCGFKSKV